MRRSPRLLLTVLPALLLAAVAASAIWGDNGLLVRHQLDAQLDDAQAELAQLERENERALRDLKMLDSDPIVLERLVADELSWGRDDATLIRFDEPTGAPQGVPVADVPQ
ncbi:MAG: septum formation initiator family protein [Myxococcota bacterium]